MSLPTLHLHLKGEYFDAIKSGTKTDEFRLVSKWRGTLKDAYAGIMLYRGYPGAGEAAKRLWRPWAGYRVRRITHPHFGPGEVEVFAIRVN